MFLRMNLLSYVQTDATTPNIVVTCSGSWKDTIQKNFVNSKETMCNAPCAWPQAE